MALGVAIGGAMLSKLSTLVLLPACILAMFGWRWAVNVHRCHSDRASTGVFYGPAGSQIPGLRPSVTVACAILIVLWAGYRFSLVPVTTAAARPHTSVDQVVGPTGALHDLAYAIVEFPMLPLSELVQGIADLAEHNAAGRHSYLLGELSDTGRLWFFPIALMVKTPIPFLLLTAVGGAMSLRASWRSGIWKTAVPALSAAAILLAVLPSRINLGVRHVLPIYPFLAIVAGLGLARLAELAHPRFAGPVAAALLLGWHLASGLAVHPDYIAYFNEAVGQHPDRVLVDSDLDWGQDLYRLRDTLHRLEITELAALIHGHTGMHDLTRHDLSAVRPFDPELPPHGWVAISVYYLRMDPRLSWLLACEPVATVGRSIRLYHFQADELPRAIGMHPARNC